MPITSQTLRESAIATASPHHIQGSSGMSGSFRTLAALGPPDRYETPPLVEVKAEPPLPGGPKLLRLVLILENGFELVIPMTADSTERLAKMGAALARNS